MVLSEYNDEKSANREEVLILWLQTA